MFGRRCVSANTVWCSTAEKSYFITFKRLRPTASRDFPRTRTKPHPQRRLLTSTLYRVDPIYLDLSTKTTKRTRTTHPTRSPSISDMPICIACLLSKNGFIGQGLNFAFEYCFFLLQRCFFCFCCREFSKRYIHHARPLLCHSFRRHDHHKHILWCAG